MIRTYKGLPRSIYVLFTARIINSFGCLVYILLPFLLKDKLGYTEIEVARIIFCMGFFAMIAALIGGKLADSAGRKYTYLIAEGISASILIYCSFLPVSRTMIYFIIAADFFRTMIRPISSSMIADLTNVNNRKQAFSLIYLGANIGVALGSMVGGLLYNLIGVAFIIDGVTTIISLIYIGIYVPETKPTKEDMHGIESEEQAEEGSVLKVLLGRPVLIIFIILTLVNNIIYTQNSYSIPLYLQELFDAESGARIMGFMMSFNAFVVVTFTVFLTRITRKLKPLYIMGIGSFMYAIGFGMLAYTKVVPLFFVSTFFWTIGEILAATNSGVFIANHSPINLRGRFNSIVNIMVSAGHMVAPTLAGYYLGVFNFKVLWLTVGVIGIINGLCFFRLCTFDKKLTFNRK